MKKAICSILIVALALGTSIIVGCSSDEVKQQVEKEKAAQESAKKSLENKPVKDTPVGNPFPTVKNGQTMEGSPEWYPEKQPANDPAKQSGQSQSK